MSLKVVSANYFDRDASNRWLIRPAHVEPDEDDARIKAVPLVIVSDVCFVRSNEAEDGFGCTVVGICSNAETELTRLHLHEMEKAITLHFNFDSFEDEDGNTVRYCDKLYLLSDGTMRVILPADEKAVAA